MRTLRATRFEVLRLLTWRRWLLPSLALFAAVFVTCRHVARSARAIGGTPSGWDVHAALLSSRWLFNLVVVMGFVLLVGHLVAGDRQSRLSWLVLPRAGGRVSWWLAKLATVLAAAVMVQLLLVLLCLGTGAAVEGWSLSPAPSSYAVAAATAQAPNPEAPLPILFPDMYSSGGVGRHLLIAAYEALAFAALAAVLLAISVRHPLSVLPALVALVGLVADSLLTQRFSGWWWPLSAGSRLLEGNHTYLAGPWAYTWSGSLVYWLAMIALASVAGLVALRHIEL